MKIVCSQSDFASNLSLVSRAVPSRPTHPVLANILLQASSHSSQINLTAFDLSLGISTSFTAGVLEEGEIALPSKLILDIISKLPEGDITLTSKEEGDGVSVTIKPKSGKYQVRGMGAEEFPELPVVANTSNIQIPSEALSEGLKRALFAVSSDETKQALTGLHIKFIQECLEFAATDGHRLVIVELKREIDSPTLEEPVEVTLPAKALRELQKMLSSAGEIVDMCIDQGQTVFTWGNQRLTSRTLEGHYPSYWQLIPQQFERLVTLERKQFISALERISVLADQKNNIVKISIDNANQEITLSCEAQDVGSGTESIPAQVSGDDIEVAFNVKYLMEGLKELPSSEIQMHLNQQLNPVIFTPLGGLKMTYLAMPVQIR